MSTSTSAFKEVLPKTGQLYQEDIPNLVLCKPKLLPLKSVTLEKLEQMQKDAQETVKQQELEAQQEQQMMFGAGGGIGSSTGESQSISFD